MNCEITIRSVDTNRFVLEGRWPETSAKVVVEFSVDPHYLSLAQLILLAEETRKQGEREGTPT